MLRYPVKSFRPFVRLSSQSHFDLFAIYELFAPVTTTQLPRRSSSHARDEESRVFGHVSQHSDILFFLTLAT